jgi:uncharacterized protein YkwD
MGPELLAAALLEPSPPPEPMSPVTVIASATIDVAPAGTRPLLALADTAPPPPGLLAAGPAAVTLADPAPRPAAPAAARELADPLLVRVVALTNAERAAVGVAPVSGNAQLTLAAQRYADVMADTACFGHNCGPLPQLGDRAWAAGDARWGFLGENVAAGQPTPERVVAAWMASPTHRAVLLDPEFTLLGVGRAVGGPYGTYWTQEFGTPSAGAPVAAPEAPATAVDVAMARLNAERAGAGLRPLRIDLRLVPAVPDAVADLEAAGVVTRATPAGGTEATALTEPGPPGPAAPADAVAAWLVTAHDMLLDPAFVDAGVGVVASDQGQGPGQVNWTGAPGAPAA